MSNAGDEALALVLLVAVIGAASLRPRWQAPVAVVASAVVLGTGVISWNQASEELLRLAPVVGFLVAVLVLATGCDREGLFQAAGDRVARWSSGSPVRLLAGGFGLAAVSTVVLSLDTTVVLVTPVVVAAARRRQVSPAPVAYASGHLANSASLLLPVSNLTNLLALAAVPIGFGRFTGLMTLPWLGVLAIEWVGLRLIFAPALRIASPIADGTEVRRWPVFAAATVIATLAGFVIASAAGVPVAWPAGAGAALLVGLLLLRGRTTIAALVGSGQLDFAVMVLGLGIVVAAAGRHGLGSGAHHLLPAGTSWAALLGVAAVSALLANVVNNLPATLLLLPLVAPAGVGPVLALLIGVDVGPNLTYAGSLATLLWRRQVGSIAELRRFTVLGLATVPAGILLAVTLLWLALKI